ncbi:heavy-metal-associated domain-containing protein [Sunxiuqinia sp. A32]|uniref:heavy-metal-associated domain-containing protein n=1 Tax=Sunxiuqinia sp. A32 TaxID=3461496 RepID=UPI00404590C8
MKTHTIFLSLLIGLIAFACSSSKSEKEKATTIDTPTTNVELVYHVEGMTCDHCEMSIQKGVNELEGIVKVEANHEDSTTLVVFDSSKTNKNQIAQAIEKRGYKVVE